LWYGLGRLNRNISSRQNTVSRAGIFARKGKEEKT
jgi:hypothetical protein